MLLEPIPDQRARPRRVDGGVGLDLGGVEEEPPAPHPTPLEALRHDPLEEAPKDPQAESIPDAGERGVFRERLEEVVSQVPTQREAIRGNPHELPLAPQILEEHD